MARRVAAQITPVMHGRSQPGAVSLTRTERWVGARSQQQD